MKKIIVFLLAIFSMQLAHAQVSDLNTSFSWDLSEKEKPKEEEIDVRSVESGGDIYGDNGSSSSVIVINESNKEDVLFDDGGNPLGEKTFGEVVVEINEAVGIEETVPGEDPVTALIENLMGKAFPLVLLMAVIIIFIRIFGYLATGRF